MGAVIRETGNPYFGNGDAVVIDIAAARVRARQERMKANRAAACGVCAGRPDFGALQLRATRPCWLIGLEGCDDSMKVCLLSRGCETRPARGEPALAGSEALRRSR